MPIFLLFYLHTVVSKHRKAFSRQQNDCGRDLLCERESLIRKWVVIEHEHILLIDIKMDE
jgi:hypothetical protein